MDNPQFAQNSCCESLAQRNLTAGGKKKKGGLVFFPSLSGKKTETMICKLIVRGEKWKRNSLAISTELVLDLFVLVSICLTENIIPPLML